MSEEVPQVSLGLLGSEARVSEAKCWSREVSARASNGVANRGVRVRVV